MPNLKCKICGIEFPPIKEWHYISRDLTKTGLAAAFGSYDEPAMFDSYDCPYCGSQVIAQPRKYQYAPEFEEVANDKPAADVNNGIVFFKCETCDHEQKHTSFVKPMKKPSSLYFITEDEAATALKAMRKMVEENGFVSINMVNEILGGEHHILSKWGWTDLSKARIVKSENYGGYYISFPSVICDRPKLGEVCDEL